MLMSSIFSPAQGIKHLHFASVPITIESDKSTKIARRFQMKILSLLASLFFSKKLSKAKKRRAKRIRARKRRLALFGLSVLGIGLAAAKISLDVIKHQKERNTHLFYGSRY